MAKVKRFKPVTSARPVQRSNQLSNEAATERALVTFSESINAINAISSLGSSAVPVKRSGILIPLKDEKFLFRSSTNF